MAREGWTSSATSTAKVAPLLVRMKYGLLAQVRQQQPSGHGTTGNKNEAKVHSGRQHLGRGVGHARCHSQDILEQHALRAFAVTSHPGLTTISFSTVYKSACSSGICLLPRRPRA